MLNLRALYGSRMPQPLHPRSDPEVSSYWEHDTAASREIARAMAEAEAADRAEDGSAGEEGDTEGAGSVLKKPAAAMFEDGNPAVGGRVRGRPFALSIQLADLLAPSTSDLPALLDGDAMLSGSPPHSQLSPTGLISIAAADIDEASTSPRPGAPRDLDWEFIATLRRRAEGGADSGAERRPSTSRRVNEVVAQLMRQSPAAGGDAEGEAQSPLRFLSLLRRINEIRSQQHVDHEAWEGLPYPQILALPTFRYQKREAAASSLSQAEEGGEEDAPGKSLCAVCYTDYEEGEEVRTLPCLHFYHRECIDQWLLHHRLCPICKHVVAVY